MPYPIRKNQETMQEDVKASDLSNLIPFIQQPLSTLQDLVLGEKDKKNLKSIWLQSETKDNKTIKVSQTISAMDIDRLVAKGLIDYVDRDNKVIFFTERGSKKLKEAILDNEKTSFSFTKKASNELLLKNVYDFGKEVLVRINNAEKFGSRYITMSREKVAEKGVPVKVSDYNIETKKSDGSYKELSDYSELELIKVLHLAKRIINNHQSLRFANGDVVNIPVNRIKAFTELIMTELEKR